MRKAKIARKTTETDITVDLTIDGKGTYDIRTGVAFLDHMLALMARHGLMDLSLSATGDLQVDAHHTVEDVGLCLGKAFGDALGGKEGIARYGSARVPMNEALAHVDVDISSRPFLVFNADLPRAKVGQFDAELTREFLHAFVNTAQVTLHVNLLYGDNVHHCIEAIFKALGRALSQAVTLDDRIEGVMSTKGNL
ncbi:MAG: imidazoleglycerol-phosphate dehydratase HisB [Candidatus Abyssobacteria bacterium SURF_17]|uniref:Imidazoleglycerol-phosphate dehydratase n=1 Tax=Candidatus Abyssobacteria bacterium SURF_17 TaxID=2093361 RepID=A0A419EZN1_9BACT|nr:MAG: imidazoleglycerol-phosphate dehydratase HisB [Candidatus Abyssubacteria bacterium SURF_17]